MVTLDETIVTMVTEEDLLQLLWRHGRNHYSYPGNARRISYHGYTGGHSCFRGHHLCAGSCFFLRMSLIKNSSVKIKRLPLTPTNRIHVRVMMSSEVVIHAEAAPPAAGL